MGSRPILRIVTVLFVMVVAACGRDRPADAVSFVETDSAGISIVENLADTAALRSGWVIAGQPTVAIGGADAPEPEQLYQVSGALRLPDGRIAVANGGASQIRVFGADGVLLSTFGRKGEGPGEYAQPTLAGRMAGDSLVVFDAGLRRASILTADSGYIRSYAVGTEGGGFPMARGTLPDGSITIGGGMYFSSADGFPNGLIRAPSKYVIIAPDGTIRLDLGDYPAAEMFARSDGSRFSATIVPFGRLTGYAVTPELIWIGTGDDWSIRGFALDGRLERIARFDRSRRPVTAELRQAAIEEKVENASNENQARELRAQMADVPIPGTMPPWELFLADALGDIWIGEFLAPGEESRTWTIMDPLGHAIGRVTTPLRTLPLDIGPDYILGLTLDELNVESLTLWPLQRPAAN
jgi:hypothetical protein